MRWLVVFLLAVHGLIHLMGFAKAFGDAALPQLTQPISRGMGLLWLAAACLVVATAVMTVAWPSSFWIFGAVALVISQGVILSAWTDARAGTVTNVILLMVVAHGWLTEGPTSFRAQFDRDVAAGLARPIEAPVVTEADLVANALGDVMDRSEAVTLFNDMALLAPATLLDTRVVWEPVDARTVHATFTNGDLTIAATLLFGDDGLLSNFTSDDRSRSSPDGKAFTRLRFSTPVRDYRDGGPARLAAHGEARWLLPEGEFTYGEFDLEEVAYNVRR